MAYIDIAFYRDYSGDSDTPDDQLALLIQRANDLIDSVTRHRILPLDRWNAPTQTQIKKATAALTEFAVQNGGLDTLINGSINYGGNIQIGTFRYGDGRITGGSGGPVEDRRIPDTVLGYLLPTGLLDTAVGRVGCG